MNAPRAPPTSRRALLASAVSTPGLIHEAYQRFHRYSVHNQLLALGQCVERGIAPGPLRTFKGWQTLGRAVMRGQKARVLCMPVTLAPTDAEEDDRTRAPRTIFVYRARWFTLGQTEGKPYEEVGTPTWSEDRALSALGITRVAFAHLDGNVQGYATPQREIAINPVAGLPHKTLFHEIAHVLLDHARDETVPRAVREVEAEGVALLCCEALGFEGAAYARGYIQEWLRGEQFSEESAQRILRATGAILAAGDQDGS